MDCFCFLNMCMRSFVLKTVTNCCKCVPLRGIPLSKETAIILLWSEIRCGRNAETFFINNIILKICRSYK